MKKLVSLILSVVMLVTSVISINLSASAAETTISPGETKKITIADVFESKKVSFVPAKSGIYYLYSTGDYDTLCDLSDESGDICGRFDDEIGINFVACFYFIAGSTYYFDISSYDFDAAFSITLSTQPPVGYESEYGDNPAISIELEPANDIVFYQGVPSYTMTDDDDKTIEVYDLSEQLECEDNKLTVGYLDGTEMTYTSKYILGFDDIDQTEIHPVLRYIPQDSDYEDIPAYMLTASDLSGYDLAAGDYTVNAHYQYATTKMQVSIVENPVASIEYISNNSLKEGVDNLVNINEDGEAEDLYFYYAMEGDTLTVNYTDGTSELFTAVVCTCPEYIDEESLISPVHFVSDKGNILHEDENFTIGSIFDIEENNYGVGVNDTVCKYMGRTDDFSFIVEPTDIESIEVTPLKTTLELGKDNADWASPYIYFECPDFNLKVTYKNGDVKEYSFDEIENSTEIGISVYDDQIEGLFGYNPWLPGQEHQFVVYCTAALYDTIDVRITGRCRHSETDFDYDGFYEATTTEDGYTGDIVCVACGEYISDGYVIPMVTSFKLDSSVLTYNGSVQTPVLTVKDRMGNELIEDEDYVVYYPDSKNTGKYEIEVELIGAYCDTKTVTYSIKPRTAVISAVKPVANGFTVNWGKRPETTGYQIQYATKADFSNAATIYAGPTNTTSKTITGRAAGTKYYVRVRTYKNVGGSYVWGNWSYSSSVTTPSKPAATSIKSVSGVKNGFTIKWNKVSTTTGYQIQYATKADFSNAATVYGGATNTTSKTITGRAAKTKYYVRVRTYKNIGGKYVWGNWSAAKTVTTK